jgi:hypothetical protein
MKTKPKRKGKATKPRPVGLQRNGKMLGGITGKGFLPGQSGNILGKRPGTISPTAVLKRCLTKADAKTIVLTLIAKAKRGDLNATKLILDRIDLPQSGPLAVAALNMAILADTAERTPRTIATLPDSELERILLEARQRGALPNVSVTINSRQDTCYAAKVLELPASVTALPATEPEEPEPEGEEDNGVLDAKDFLES